MKQPKKPKPRGVWKINPKTRVAPSKKKYSRAEESRKLKKFIDWFGEQE